MTDKLALLGPTAMENPLYAARFCARIAGMTPGEYRHFLEDQGCTPGEEEPYKGTRLIVRPGRMPVAVFSFQANGVPMPEARKRLLEMGFTCNDFYATATREGGTWDVSVEVY